MKSSRRWKAWLGLATVGGLLWSAQQPGSTLPVFARRYGFSCQACHTEIPHLTAFGSQFLANGYRIKGLSPKGTFPVAVRVDLLYSDRGAIDTDSVRGPIPQTNFNEIEVLTGGSIGNNFSYWGEQYLVDGGYPGATRDLWVADRVTADTAHTPIVVRAGQFTLPLPIDPESFRETALPYAIWGITAGYSPFTLFAPKDGVQVQYGDPTRAVAGTLNFMQGHDELSQQPSTGVDTMETLKRILGDFQLDAYRYDGSRILDGAGYNGFIPFQITDRFWRNGFGVGWNRGRTEIENVYQIGNDSESDPYGDALITSGDFLQVRQTIGDRSFALARWDATAGGTGQFSRALTYGLGTRLTRNTRLTLFDTAQQDRTNTYINTISSGLVVAF